MWYTNIRSWLAIIAKNRQSTRSRLWRERCKRRPALEVLEERTLLSTTQALFALDTPTFTNGSTNTNWINVSANAVYSGTTINAPPQTGNATLINSSLKSPMSGAIILAFDPAAPVGGGVAFNDPTNTVLDASLYSNARTAGNPFGGAPTPLQPTIGGGASGSPGSAPADLGTLLTITIIIPFTLGRTAVRDFSVTLSTLVPLAVTGDGPAYTFDPTATLTTKTGTLDYNISANLLGNTLTAVGATSIAGASTTNFGTDIPTGANLGTITNLMNAQGQWTLRLPVLANVQQLFDTDGDTVNDTTVNLNIAGTLLGTWTPPLTLYVSSLQSTNSGFVAQFNRAFTPEPLNLYSGIDPSGNVLGSADVTLVGASSGNVKGSIVLAPDNTSFAFVATGGALLPDTYTITMRSATDGFFGVGGASDLLDGNLDDTGGDDYSNSLVIASSLARVVSVPDFARGPGQTVNVPNDTGSGIPITISDGDGITSMGFDLLYSTSLLTVSDFSFNSGVTGTFSTPSSGVAHVDITSPLSSGPVTLGSFTASIPNSAGYGSKQVLNLTNIILNGGAVSSKDNDAIHVVGYFGDATANGQITSADAQRALRVAVGLDSGFSAYQLADPRIGVDINGDGRVNSADATRILQKAVGLSVPAIPDVPSIGSLTPGGPDPYLHIPKTFAGKVGDTLVVPVLVDKPEGLDSFDLAITFDNTRLEAMSVQLGSLASNFEIFLPLINNSTGSIIVAASTIRALGDIGQGSLVLLTFRIKADAQPGPATINLRNDFNGVTTALSEGYLVLQPLPSNASGDVLDGSIAVRANVPTLRPIAPKSPLKPAEVHSGQVQPAARFSIFKRVASSVPWFSDVTHLLNRLLNHKKK